jgi:outer membrane receptor protein involved in Fe transport
MRVDRLVRLVLLVGWALWSADPASGQVITGSLDGTIRDSSNALLPGVTVTLSSPDLPSGTQVTVTDGTGTYRLRNLPPGLYSFRAELAGFGTYEEQGIRIQVGGTIERNVTLQVGTVAETVTVSGAAPVIDTSRSGVSTNIETELLERTPLRRFSMFDFVKSAPGISSTSPTSGSSTAVSAFGSGVDENQWLLDGTDFTSPGFGSAWPWPDTDVIEEIEVISFGASAEYGNMQGAVFNVVTRQGTNDWRIAGSYYNMSQKLTSQPITQPCDVCPGGQSGFHRDRFHDFGMHTGGRILRDKMWIYGGYQYQRDYDTQPGNDPAFPRAFEADRIYWKYTWQMTKNLKFMQNYHDDYWVIPDTPSLSRPFPTVNTFGGRNPSVTFGDVTHVVSDTTLWDARFSGFISPNDYTRPNSGSNSLPRTIDRATDVASGGAPYFGSFHQVRLAANAKVTHYANDFLGADHDFKFGGQFVHGSTRSLYGYTGGTHLYTYNGEPYYAYSREPYVYGGQFRNVGLFAEDAVKIKDRLTVNAGVRYDYNKAISQDLPAYDAAGNKTGDTIRGLGDLYTWNVFAPRLGFNLKVTGDARTILRGQYGRFYQGMFTSDYSFVHPGITPVTLAFFDPATGQYSDIVSVVDPKADLRVDPQTKPPYTDQYSIGFDRELPWNLGASVTYIHKDGKNFTGWQDIGGRYGSSAVTLANGQTLDALPLLNETGDRQFLLTNPSSYFMRYNGVLLTLKKRWAQNWQALASYTGSKTEGLQGANGSGPASSQSSRGGSTRFGRDPNDLINATGRLLNDRPHMFTLQGSFEVPRTGVMIGANTRILTGKPYAAQALVRLPQGTRSIYIEPLGSQRLPIQKLVDFRVSKAFRFQDQRKVEFILDVLNLGNSTAAEDIVSRNFFASTFASPNRWIDPRRAMLGVKFSY